MRTLIPILLLPLAIGCKSAGEIRAEKARACNAMCTENTKVKEIKTEEGGLLALGVIGGYEKHHCVCSRP